MDSLISFSTGYNLLSPRDANGRETRAQLLRSAEVNIGEGLNHTMIPGKKLKNMTQEELEKLNNPVNTNQVTGKNSPPPIHTLVAKNFPGEADCSSREGSLQLRPLPGKRKRKRLPAISRGYLTSSPCLGVSTFTAGAQVPSVVGEQTLQVLRQSQKRKTRMEFTKFLQRNQDANILCNTDRTGSSTVLQGCTTGGILSQERKMTEHWKHLPPVVPFI